jgi:hypothetical protein
MLTIRHPALFPELVAFPMGIRPVSISGEPRIVLIVKAVKEVLLTAKTNLGFKIYAAPLEISDVKTIALISAFFDDPDEPLVLFTPMHADEEHGLMLRLLLASEIDVYLFDEHGREWLGYTADVSMPDATRALLTSASLLPFSLDTARQAHDAMPRWFGLRTTSDDSRAIEIRFGTQLVPGDVFIQDLRPEHHAYHGSRGFSSSSLERPNPGSFQEEDIVRLLMRTFRPDQIYLNPLRPDDNKEICDILLVTEQLVLVIQAKDLAHVPSVVMKPVTRKQHTSVNKLNEALGQVSGALRYITPGQPLAFKCGEALVTLDIEHKKICSLVILTELFNTHMAEYSEAMLKLVDRVGTPCVTLDYGDLVMYSSHLVGEEAFFGAYDRVFNFAVENRQYPRLRLGLIE